MGSHMGSGKRGSRNRKGEQSWNWQGKQAETETPGKASPSGRTRGHLFAENGLTYLPSTWIIGGMMDACPAAVTLTHEEKAKLCSPNWG